MNDQVNIQRLLENPREILGLEARDPRRAEAFWHGLSRAERLRAVLACQGSERLRLIVLAQDADTLVRELPPDEFLATTLDVGPDAADALVAASTDDQLAYLLDITGWQGERLWPQRYQLWLPAIVEAGAERIARWLAWTDVEVLALLFAHWFRVVKFLTSHDEQEPPDDLPGFSLDGVYFIEFRQKEMQDYASQVLVVLKSQTPDRYTQILEAMLWESAIGMAEDALILRAGRLADLGMPSRAEALELWAAPPPKEAAWRDLPTKDETGFLADAPPRSDAALNLLPRDHALPALARALPQGARDRLRAELAYVANCGVMALDVDPTDLEAVARAGREAVGLVNLGLELLSDGDRSVAGRILERLGLAALARQGAQAIRQLNARAWRLVNEGWLVRAPGGLHILDEPLDRWLAGLLFPHPRCYDQQMGEGREYRGFRDLADLEHARRGLDLAEFWGELLGLMGVAIDQLAQLSPELARGRQPLELKLTAVVGTFLARGQLGLDGLWPIPAALAPRAVAALQRGLAQWRERRAAESVEALADPAKAEMAGQLLRGVLGRIQRDLAAVDASKVDPRFIASLVVEK